MLDHANKQRMTASGDVGQTESIQISQFWEEQLRSMPYISRKCNHIYLISFYYLYRQAGQDPSSAQGEEQADLERQEA